MKRALCNLALICLLTPLLWAAIPDRGVYRLPRDARQILVEMKATVRHGTPGEDYVAELTPEQVIILRQRGFQPELLSASLIKERELLRSSYSTDDFHSYDEIRSDFYAYAALYPSIAQLVVLGTSMQNRELFALRLSDNVAVEEVEPEIAFWGNIHGNEYTGGELPYLYALYLCDNYGIDPEVTQYVNNNEIWCIPMINPDGRVNGWRDNANGVDLNRDFGYQWDGWGGSWYAFSQIETRTVREFCLANNISLSTTFHCSGDVVFYQWGYSPQTAPDLGTILRVGERYAEAANYAFINSWDDYETHGELLDFLYGSQGGFCYTVETNPFASQVNQTFARNQAGMNIFCDIAVEGLHGTVTDALTGAPLSAAVWIAGSAIPSYTDPNLGDVHRLILPGTYNLTIWANGYLPQTINGVVVGLGSPGQFQAQLQPGGGEHAFMVTSVNQHDPNNVHNQATKPAWALGAPDGLPGSLGSAGFIVLDMGAGHEILDGAGPDFTVTEAIAPRDPNPEGYRVFAGDAYNQEILIGLASGTASFDLNGTGVNSTRYLKIVDASGANPDLALAGMDLDGITVLNSAATAGVALQPLASLPAACNVSAAPNPFNPTTTIRFDLSVPSRVTMQIFDVKGQRIGLSGQVLLQDEWLAAGHHELTFDGSQLASGVYFYRLQTGSSEYLGKLMLIK